MLFFFFFDEKERVIERGKKDEPIEKSRKIVDLSSDCYPSSLLEVVGPELGDIHGSDRAC